MIQKLIDLLMDTLPDDSPWAGNIKGLVDHLIANGVTFATDNNVGDKMTPTDKDTNVLTNADRILDRGQRDQLIQEGCQEQLEFVFILGIKR